MARARSLPALAAVSLAVAACGSSTKSASHTTSAAGSASHAGTASHAKSSGTAITTTKVPGYGTVLATSGGAPVYVLSTDPQGGSRCSGACTRQWPPVTAAGSPRAGSGVKQSLLSSFRRHDGTTQVLYAGHALYRHAGSNATAVAGTAADGGIWYLVAPSGDPVKSISGSGY